MKNDVAVIIPAFNEEKTVGLIIDSIRKSEVKTNIIVVDNCSTDKTSEIAKMHNVQVVYCGNQGKGFAMEEGLKHVKEEIVVFVDGDLNIHSQDVIKMVVDPIRNENYDLVKSTFEREGGRVTELVAKPLLELLFPDNCNFSQPLSGIIAGKKEKFDKIELEKDYGVDIGILLDMIKMNAKIKEVNIGTIDNCSQSWKSLSKMSKQVMVAILKRANAIK